MRDDEWARVALAELVTASRRLGGVDADDLDAVLQAVVAEAHRIVGERALVALLDGDQLVCRAVAGPGVGAVPGDRLSVLGTLNGLAVLSGETQVCVDAYDDPRIDAEFNRRVGVRSSVVVPLTQGGCVLGTLMVMSGVRGRFAAEHRDAVTLLALTAAQAVAVALARAEGRTARAALADSRRMLGAARELSGAGVWRWDIATGRLEWSDEMYRMAGVRRGEVEPTIELWNALILPDDLERCLENRDLGVSGDDGYQQHFRLLARDGVVRHLHTWSQVERDSGGAPVRVVGATIDVTELARLTRTDPVTGLYNRVVLDEQLSVSIAALPPDGDSVVALLLCDLDRFKLVNETLGHQAGDVLLAQVAARLMTTCPAGSLVARLGGDEFAVLLPAVRAEDSLAVADRIVESCRQPFGLSGDERLVATTTVGVALARRPDRDPGDVFREADLALYRAKGGGRNRVSVFDDAMRADVEARVRTEGTLRTALDAGRLAVVYQPVVSLRTGAVHGFEALGRVIDPEVGALSPATFIDVAEETGLVVAFDAWVLEQAATLVARWGTGGPSTAAPPIVGVNFSARTLEQPDLSRTVEQVLRRCGVDGSRLLIEITEHSLLDGGPQVRRELRTLHQLGVAVGIDDFGTGWSAMSYLATLHLQFMKIDRSFVLRVADGDDRADAVLQAIVSLGHAHGLQVVAEGVETEHQAQRLRDMGCDYAQGWWFARPVPDTQLADTVVTWHARAAALPWAPWGGNAPTAERTRPQVRG